MVLAIKGHLNPCCACGRPLADVEADAGVVCLPPDRGVRTYTRGARRSSSTRRSRPGVAIAVRRPGAPERAKAANPYGSRPSFE